MNEPLKHWGRGRELKKLFNRGAGVVCKTVLQGSRFLFEIRVVKGWIITTKRCVRGRNVQCQVSAPARCAVCHFNLPRRFVCSGPSCSNNGLLYPVDKSFSSR